MSGRLLLDWAALSISLFNTLVLIWLGLTVLLNAERRTAGVWLAGLGLLMGGAFFISHSAILGQRLDPSSPGLNFWWSAAWLPVILSPFAWYIVILWYTGYWDSPSTDLHRRQQPWYMVAMLCTLGMGALLIFTHPIPTFAQIAELDLSDLPSVLGIPVIFLAYPAYILLCILLALDALLRPGPSMRPMGNLARRRARPWLVASTFVLLAVSLLVAAALMWVVMDSGDEYGSVDIYQRLSQTLAWFDLIIAALIGLAVLLLGQAVVVYEIFTGKSLPRRELRRAWHSAIFLAVSISPVAAGGYLLQVKPIYSLLASLMLVTVFFALYTWRSFSGREAALRQVRPFLSSQRLYDQLIQPGDVASDLDVQSPLAALVTGLLGAERGALAPLGSLATLAGPPMFHPPGSAAPLPRLHELAARVQSPGTSLVPIEPADFAGLRWAAPLWGERGLIGLLLLGDKPGGGFYTQEEIDLARSSGERLLDIQASAGLARQLVELQRQRQSESQTLELHTRRSLHDEVLPLLHTALLLMQADPQDAQARLSEAHHRISDLLHELPAPAAPEIGRLGLLPALRRLAESELRGRFDGLEWQISPEIESRTATLPTAAAEALYYAAREALRNSAAHGRGSTPQRSLHVKISAAAGREFSLVIEDDGVGLENSVPGSGSRSGLALHGALLAVAGGALSIESEPDRFTRVTLSMPLPES
ncbi:histidine kinase [Longilinea arvoryzae]|uniref:Histidine kinase n=1 Tax=Longilinea arvoryzae TaxID=360412 RepID=A0A0S7BMT7_9CHLR|nr:ATP-binding protein [Longilinea arvoryzae]GAP15830.1 histidine kinase [Longilinea arvoryzae]